MPVESLLEVARALLVDADAKVAFRDDPEGYLAARGFDALSPGDLADAADLVADTLPADVAVQLAAPEGGAGSLAGFAELEPVALDLDDDGRPDEFTDPYTSEERTVSNERDETERDEALGAPEPSAVPDPGFGVGYSNDDLDDISAPAVHEGELPVGFELPLDEAGLLESGHDFTHDLPDPEAHSLESQEIPAHGHPDPHEDVHHDHPDVDLDPD